MAIDSDRQWLCNIQNRSQIVLLTNMTQQAQFEQPTKKANIYLIGGIAAMAGLLFGFDTGVISGAQEFLFKTFDVGGASLRGFVVSSVPLGALLGAMVSGYFAKELGRRRSIMMAAILFLIGTLAAAFAPNLHSVVLGRLLMGLAIGISAMVVPMYLSEVSPAKVRGTIIFLFQLAITLGLMGAFAINLAFSSWIHDVTTNWRWMFGVGIVPSFLLLLGMAFIMPNSPRWLMLKGRRQEATKVLQYLLGKDDVSECMEEMEESLQHEGAKDWTLLLRKPLLPLILMTFGLFVFQQLSGINAIMYYGPEVFASAGFGDKAKFLAQLLMGLTNVIATVFGVWVIDKLGRRPLLFIGFSGMVVCLGLLSFCLASGGTYAGVGLASTLLYVVFFAISLGGVPYIMMSEVFPLKSRSAGMAIASCANWLFNMLVSFSFVILVDVMGGMDRVFMLYAACTLVGLFFAWRYVPETKGRNLEDIEHNLYKGKALRDIGNPVNHNKLDSSITAFAPEEELKAV